MEIRGNLAQFDIMELETEAEWPGAVNPLATGQPVYLAMEGSFKPDPEPQGTEAEIQAFLKESHRQGSCTAGNMQEAQEEI